MIKTPICEMLGIEYPIFQGGMAWIADGRLAAAVSEGGGLGIISAMNAGTDYLKREIDICRSLTKKPFGVNVMLMSPHVEEVAKLLAEEKVPVITTGAGNPGKYMKLWQSAGIRVIPVVASVAMAKLVTRQGACAVIAEGGESGGHVGDLTTMALLPQVCDATPLPVIGAGGIADGRGIAASLLMGASGVQMGTRFLLAEECSLHPKAKDAIMAAADTDSVVTGFTTGDSVRGLKNRFSDRYLKAEYSGASPDELSSISAGTTKRGALLGDTENGFILAGMSLTHLTKIQSAKEIVEELVSETERRLVAAPGLI